MLLYISAFHMFWKFLQVDICILLCVGVIYAAIISQALGLVYIVEGAFDGKLHLTNFYRTLLPIKTSTLSSTKIIVSSNKRHRVKFIYEFLKTTIFDIFSSYSASARRKCNVGCKHQSVISEC